MELLPGLGGAPARIPVGEPAPGPAGLAPRTPGVQTSGASGSRPQAPTQPSIQVRDLGAPSGVATPATPAPGVGGGIAAEAPRDVAQAGHAAGVAGRAAPDYAAGGYGGGYGAGAATSGAAGASVGAGLSRALWAGGNGPQLMRDVASVPVATPSRAHNLLAARLLSSDAPPPPGIDPRAWTETRAERLADAGLGAAVYGVAGPTADDALQRRAADGALAAGRGDAACELAYAPHGEADDGFWRKLLIYCQLRRGEAQAARIGADLLREEGYDDPSFMALADAALGFGAAAAPANGRNVSPLHLAMMALADLAPPAASVAEARPLLMAPYARLDRLGGDARIAAAEAAHRFAAMDGEALARIYRAVGGGGDVSSGAGAAANARAYAAVMRETSGPEIAFAVDKALAQAARTGALPEMAGALRPALLAVDPLIAGAIDADRMIRALLLAGEADAAAAWGFAARKPESLALLELAVPGRVAAPPNAYLGWADAARRGERGGRRALAVFAAFGLADAPPVALAGQPASPYETRLRAAMSVGRPGEIALYALHAIGRGGPQASRPETLRLALESLTRAGFEAEARALGLEALILGRAF